MFDGATAFYNKYFGAGVKTSELVVGVELRDQSLPFMFEVIESNGLPGDQYLLPLPPEAYRKVETPRATVTMTLGGAFEDKSGMAPPKISLQGTFGYMGTYGEWKTANSLSSTDMDGWELFKEIETILLAFYERFGTASKNAADLNNPPELRFYSYTDEDYFTVQLNKFEILRNTQRRFLYQYDIQMTVLKRVDFPSKSVDDLIPYLSSVPTPPDLSIWGELLKQYTSAYSFMSDVVVATAELQNDLTIITQGVAGFKNGTSAFINAPSSLLNSSIRAVDSIAKTVVSLTDFPHEFINDLRNTKQTLLALSLKKELFQVKAAALSSLPTIAEIKEIMTVPLDAYTAKILGLTSMNNPEKTLFNPADEIAAQVSTSEDTISQNDTIETIAARNLGNARDWKQIALLNGLEYPFIVKGGLDAYSPVLETGRVGAVQAGDISLTVYDMTPQAGEVLVITDGSIFEGVTIESVALPKVFLISSVKNTFSAGSVVTRHKRRLAVLTFGDKIGLPGTSGKSTAVTSRDGQEFANRLYGTDEYLSSDGNHSAESGGDVATVTGLANLQMQLQHRLVTTLGELSVLGHPEYGSYLPKIIGKISTNLWYQRAILEAKITVLKDPRIEKVGQVKFQVDNAAIYLNLMVYPIGQTDPAPMTILVG